MNRFEDAVHTERRDEGELSVERFGELWAETQTDDARRRRRGHRGLPHVVVLHPALHRHPRVTSTRTRTASCSRCRSTPATRSRGRRLRPALPRPAAQPAARWPPEELGSIVGCDLADPGFWDGGLAIIERRLGRGRGGCARSRPIVTTPAPSPRPGASTSERPARRRIWSALIPALAVVAITLVASVVVAATWNADTDTTNTGNRLHAEPLLVLAAGGALGVLAGALIYSMGRSRELAYELVDEATGSLRRSEEHFRALVQHGHDLIVVADSTWRVQYVSPSVQSLLGFEPHDLLGLAVPEGIHPKAAPLSAAAVVGGSASGELTIRHRDGTWWSFEGVVTDLRDDQAVQGFVVSVHDITERQAAAQELAHQATHDPLTGLPNRSSCSTASSMPWPGRARSDRTSPCCSSTSTTSRSSTTASGHGARRPSCSSRSPTGCASSLRARRHRRPLRRRRVRGALRGPRRRRRTPSPSPSASTARSAEPVRRRRGTRSFVGVSIGIAVADDAERRSPRRCIRDADAAMYRAKERGRARCEVFDDAMRAARSTGSTSRTRLRRAARARRAACCYYQPIVDLDRARSSASRRCCAGSTPSGACSLPAEFIPVAEETGLIVPDRRLGARPRPAGRSQRWADAPEPPGTRRPVVAVNLSGRQLGQPDLVDDVALVLADTGIDPALRRASRSPRASSWTTSS